MYDINSTGRNHLIIFRYPCFIRLVLWQRYKVFHNGTIPIYGDNKYSHYLSLQSASSSVSSISIRQKACKNQSVPPWRKFCSAMVEQNFLHGGTKISPRWNGIIFCFDFIGSHLAANERNQYTFQILIKPCETLRIVLNL